MRKKKTFNDILQMCIQYFYRGILYRSVLPLRKTIWLRMLYWGYTILYTSKVKQASTHTINKLSPCIICLDFEATMTTYKLLKKRSYRQNCLISDWFGLRPFSETINPDNKMAAAIHFRKRSKI